MELSGLSHLDEEGLDFLKQIRIDHTDLLHLPGDLLTTSNILKHRIMTVDYMPMVTRQYRLAPALADDMKEQVEKLLQDGIIVHSKSPYNNPVLMVKKKPNREGIVKHRRVLDLRRLNEKSLEDSFPIPHIVKLLDRINGSKYFCTLVMAPGFLQIELDERDRHKTAFSTATGHYQKCQ